MRLHTETPERRAYINSLPEDVKAILDLFPGYILCTNDAREYIDVIEEGRDTYVFLQPIAHLHFEEEKKGAPTAEQNKARFISWVRNGLPDGYNDYDRVWTRED